MWGRPGGCENTGCDGALQGVGGTRGGGGEPRVGGEYSGASPASGRSPVVPMSAAREPSRFECVWSRLQAALPSPRCGLRLRHWIVLVPGYLGREAGDSLQQVPRPTGLPRPFVRVGYQIRTLQAALGSGPDDLIR